MKIVTVVGARPQFKLNIRQEIDPQYLPFGDGHAAEKIVQALDEKRGTL